MLTNVSLWMPAIIICLRCMLSIIFLLCLSNLWRVFSKCSFRWHSAYFHSALYPSFCRKNPHQIFSKLPLDNFAHWAFRKISLSAMLEVHWCGSFYVADVIFCLFRWMDGWKAATDAMVWWQHYSLDVVCRSSCRCMSLLHHSVFPPLMLLSIDRLSEFETFVS